MAVAASAIWRARPSGSNTNGGGYDGASYPGGTDYSQQNAAQATGVNGTASATTTFTDTTAANFTAAMVGNALWIASGAGFTVGAYFITAFGSSTSVTLDRSPGTGTVAHWAVGGGWADFWTNAASTGPVVPGNTVFVLGSGTPNPAAYVTDYTWNTLITFAAGSTGGGKILFANDPATPGYKAPPDTTGGMPTIQLGANGGWQSATLLSHRGLWFISGAAGNITAIFNMSRIFMSGCVFDQFGYTGLSQLVSSADGIVFGCEMFSSVGASGGSAAITTSPGLVLDGCNIHDTTGQGVSISSVNVTIKNSIIAKCAGNAISVGSGISGSGGEILVINNTIDGNTGHGISFSDSSGAAAAAVWNNIISNQTGVGKAGLFVGAGSTALNSSLGIQIDYNSFYNNTANYSGINAGPHDTALGVTPYNASATEDYKLI